MYIDAPFIADSRRRTDQMTNLFYLCPFYQYIENIERLQNYLYLTNFAVFSVIILKH